MPQYHKPSQPVTQLAPILLCLLLMLPALAFAAPTLTSTPDTAYTAKTCLDGSTLLLNSTIVMNDGVNVTTYAMTSERTCQNGCSTTLQDCKLNVFWDNIAFVAFVFISGLVIFAFSRLGPVGIVGIVATMLLSLLNLTWDVFSVNVMLVRLFSVAVIAFGIVMIYWYYRDDSEGD